VSDVTWCSGVTVQNSVARLVSAARRRDHITPVLRNLHWPPVRRRIMFKTAVLVWKCIGGVASPYLQEFCMPVRCPVEKVHGRPWLRSSSTGCVDLSRVQTSVYQRSFAFHGPTVWYSLPSALRDSRLSVNTFQQQLKTHLFGQSWTPSGAVVAFLSDSGAGYSWCTILA